MLNSKHSPAPTQLFENTASPQIEMLAMDQAQFEPAAADEDIQTTSTSSSTSTSTQMPNGYCSTHYGSNSNNIDTSSDEYHQYFQDAFPHNTSSTTSAPTPSPTQMDKIYKYSIELTNISQSPVISWINKTSEYQQVFNPSWIQSPDDNPSMQPGILAQVQNCTLKPGECKSCNKTSGLVFTTCNAEKNTCNPLGAPSGKVPYTSQIPGSEEKDLKGNPVFKNPSIFYWRNLFYMFVNEVTSSESQHGTNPMNETQQNIVRIFTNENPTKNSSNWTRQDGAFSKKTVTAPAALLSMNNLTNLKGSGTVYDDGIHWLFYGGEGHISVTNSCSPVHWDNIDDTPWLQPRADHFDKDGVETGPAPAKMFDGNYLMLYNGYTITSRPPSSDQKGQPPSPQINGMVVPHQIKHYEVGWVILDGKDPKHILQRSDKPLITSTYPYENGDSPYTCAQRGSVYAKAIVPLDGSSNDTHQTFRVYFSAADTSVGSAVISISYAGMNNKQETEWMTIAIVVSIACGVFVIVMFLVIWCKNKEDTNIVDLTTDPEYISIASAKFSKEISGTNHNGTSYVIGSLDSNDKRRLMGGINDGSRIERQSVYSSRNSHRGNFHKHRRHHHDHRENKRSSRRDNQKKSRRQSVRKYETNEMNPNHIHIHTTDCYDEEDNSRDCKYLNVNVNKMDIHSSLNSNSSTNSSSISSSSTSSSSCSSSGSRTMDSPSTSSTISSSSYCSHCNGKYHDQHSNDKHNRHYKSPYKSPSKTQTGTQDMSQSETMRLSQISFRINETLEKDSPTSTGKYNEITIHGYNPTTTQFSFYDRTNPTLGERLIHHERQ